MMFVMVVLIDERMVFMVVTESVIHVSGGGGCSGGDGGDGDA